MIAHRAEVLELRIEQRPLVIEQRQEIHAIGLVGDTRHFQRLARLRHDRRSQEGGTLFSSLHPDISLLHGQTQRVLHRTLTRLGVFDCSGSFRDSRIDTSA